MNPYGASKLASERAIRDFTEGMTVAKKPFAAAFLRYFNVAGCDGSGELGEHHRPETPDPDHSPVPAGCAATHRNTVTVFGSDCEDARRHVRAQLRAC